jgi:hypothetical protein
MGFSFVFHRSTLAEAAKYHPPKERRQERLRY